MNAFKISKLFFNFILLSTLIFASCDMVYNEPVREFLKEYTETAAIVSHEMDKVDYPLDKNGFVSVPSSDDVFITYTMRNPQNYLLNFDLTFEDGNSRIVADRFGESSYSFAQTDDFVQVVLKYGHEYLYAMECGGNLSGDINLSEPKSGRSFEPYNYKLKVNSVPEPVKNLVVLQDSSDNKYVLAMNMPDMSGIHKDIRVLKIDDVEYPVVLSETPDASESGIDIEKYTQFRQSYDSNWVPGALGSQFDGAEEQRAIYFKTDTAISTDEIFFTVTLIDSEGLSVESKISENSKKLSPVVYSSGYENLETNEDGYAKFSISASPSTTDEIPVDGDIGVYYKIYSYDESAPNHKGKLVKEGSGNNSAEVTLTNGKWICEAKSNKTGYINSSLNVVEISVQGFVFVQPSYTGKTSDGGKASPYKSVEEALAGVIGFDAVRVKLLEDVSLKEPLTLARNLEVSSADGFKLSGKITVPKDICLTVNSNIILDYVYVKEGGLIKTSGIAEDSSQICSVEYVPDVADKQLDGISIIEAADSSELTDGVLQRFVLKNAGYFIEAKNGKGVITVAGITLDVQTILGSYTVKVTGLNQYVWGVTGSTGATLKVSEIKDINGSSVSLEAVTAMNILLEGTLVQTNSADADKTELTIESYEYGGTYNYVLEVCFEVAGIPISAQIPFKLE